MKMLKFQVLLILLNAAGSIASHFLEKDRCAPSDRCSSKSFKTCSCEDNCLEYGTCCIDANKFPLMSTTKSLYECRSKRMETATFAKKSCSHDFKGHRDVRTMCFENDYDEADMLNHLLVTSSKTQTTYWNKHCGVCNNEDEYDLEFWTVFVSCPSKHGEMAFSESFIRKNLSFDEETKEWGLKLNQDFVRCSLKYIEPDFIIGKLKHCAPFMISSCPDSFKNMDVLKKCSHYHGERRDKRTNQYYRNIYCAMCNGVPLKYLECSDRTYEADDIFDSPKDNIEVTFSSGSWIEKKGAAKYKCSNNFQYDPMQQRCRRLETSPEPTVYTSGQNVIAPLYILTIVAFVLIFNY